MSDETRHKLAVASRIIIAIPATVNVLIPKKNIWSVEHTKAATEVIINDITTARFRLSAKTNSSTKEAKVNKKAIMGVIYPKPPHKLQNENILGALTPGSDQKINVKRYRQSF